MLKTYIKTITLQHPVEILKQVQHDGFVIDSS